MDAADHADGDAVGKMASGAPGRHRGQEPDRFHIEELIASLDDFNVGYVAVGVYYEAACDASFDPLLICFGRIFAVFVDIVKQCLVSARERWLFIYKIVFKNFLKRL